jgi:3-deoxy-D-manno-octulosonate 8-phosphate phosphatase (KDO 8-P phosphatase)
VHSPSPPPYDADLLARAAKIRLACFDVDGTLTDGRLYFDSEGRESKAFHVLDGQGLVLLRKHGIHVAFVTARASLAAEKRAADLGVEACIGIEDKLACVRQIAQRLGVGLDETSFMGDDLPDLAVMSHAGLAVAPANAHASMLPHVHWCTQARGGEGAAREFCDLVLSAQGRTEALLQKALGR